MATTDQTEHLRERYLTLLQRALTHTLYWPLDLDWNNDHKKADAALADSIATELAKPDFDWAQVRAEGKDWPKFAQTMVGLKRLDNVHNCVARVVADGVPGDLIETGVWRGGVVIFMRALLDAYGDENRVVYVADSFEGRPAPDAAYPADADSQLHVSKSLAISRDEVAKNFERYGLLDDRVRFLEGWFKDTLPSLQDRIWSVIRLDGDMYESTMDGLRNLYPQLSVGGFLIVDDYGYEPCRQAVVDYRAELGIDEPIEEIDWLGAFWRRAR
jgi:O-methyltransferase